MLFRSVRVSEGERVRTSRALRGRAREQQSPSKSGGLGSNPCRIRVRWLKAMTSLLASSSGPHVRERKERGPERGRCWAGPDGLARAGPVLFFNKPFPFFPFLCFEN